MSTQIRGDVDIQDGTITDAQIADDAAIAGSKIDLAGAIVDADVVSLSWAKITGTPTTLAGYGITDPVVVTSGAYADPAWITSLAASKLAGTIAVGQGGTGTATAFTAGSVVYAAAGGTYAQKNAALFFDAATDRFGFGTAAPTAIVQIVGAGATPSAGLTGAPMQITINDSPFSVASILRLENNAVGATDGFRIDILCGSVPGNNYLYGSIQASSPAATDPKFVIGSGSVHDFVLASAGAEILRFNRTTHVAAGPYFVMFGGTSSTFPAFKREAAEFAFRLADDTAYTGVRASRFVFGDPASAPLWSVSGGIIQARTSATPTSIDVGPIKLTASAALTNKAIWITGTLNHAGPFALYFDAALTGISGTGQGFYLTPSFSLAGASTSVAVLQIPAASVTLNAQTLTNATSVYIEGAPTAGTNRRALWIAAGKAQIDDLVQCNGLQINGSSVLTNKAIYLTGTINHSNPAVFYIDIALTGLSGGSGSFAQALFIGPSFSLSGNIGVAANLWIQQATVTLNGHTVDTAASLYITDAPSNGTNKYAIFVNAGLSKFGGAVQLTGLAAFAAGDKYVTIDANGNLHTSAIGPAS